MDLGDENKLQMHNGSGDCVNYHSPHLSSDWQRDGANFATLSASLSRGANSSPVCKDDLIFPSCSSVSMADSFHPTLWHNMPDTQPIAFNIFNDVDVHHGLNNSLEAGLSGVVPGSMSFGAEVDLDAASSEFKGGHLLPNLPGLLPHSLFHLPVDAAFIDRAAQSSFFIAGDLANVVNPFGIHEPVHPFLQGGNAMNAMPGAHPHKNELLISHSSSRVSLIADHGAMEGRRNDGRSERCIDEAHGVGMLASDSDEGEVCGGAKEEQPTTDIGDDASSAKGLSSMKKRKCSGQVVEPEQTVGSDQFNDVAKISKGGQNPISIADKATGNPGKQNSGASDPAKGEYVHIRARKGQATNSHSLAERIRREKISERMKLLQDLVPGCSKVTGKAVMLGEIINYVQSLQRQVEFLSMKLATVNPGPDFNLDEILPKDMFLSPPTSRVFSSDMPMVYPPPQPSEATIYPPGAPAIGSSSDAISKTIPSRLPTSQLPDVWQEDEFHSNIHAQSNASAPLNSHETCTGNLSQRQMKVEH